MALRWLALVFSVATGTPRSALGVDSDFDRCRSAVDGAARLHCYQHPAGKSIPLAPAGGWRLARTENPHGGRDAISVMHTPDPGRSDFNLAGLMLRCAEKSEEWPEVLVVVITPFPPRSRPEVTIVARDQEWHFVATVVPPGAELLLPHEAAALAAGPWPSAPDLSIRITVGQQSMGGVIPADGMDSALHTLAGSCA